jgi:RecA-family ATPase
MKDDYKFKEDAKKIDLELEKTTAEKLKKMSDYMKLSPGEITNVALKRFIATHKDFFPRES